MGQDETWDHIFKCLDADVEHRQLFRIIQTTSTKYNVPRIMQEMLTEGIRSYLTDSSPQYWIPTEEPYRSIHITQSKIGWDHCLQGRFSQDWAQVLQWYLRENNLKNDPTLWLVHLSRSIYEWWREMWDKRNSVVHGDTIQEQRHKKADSALEILRTLYELQPEVKPEDRSIFGKLSEHISKSSQEIRQWVLTYKNIITESARDNPSANERKVRRITRGLLPWKG